MRTKQVRPAPGERTSRKTRQKYFKHPNHTTVQKNFKSKIHTSRHPEQRRKDAAILAIFGLGFREVRGFSRLVKIGGRHAR